MSTKIVTANEQWFDVRFETFVKKKKKMHSSSRYYTYIICIRSKCKAIEFKIDFLRKTSLAFEFIQDITFTNIPVTLLCTFLILKYLLCVFWDDEGCIQCMIYRTYQWNDCVFVLHLRLKFIEFNTLYNIFILYSFSVKIKSNIMLIFKYLLPTRCYDALVLAVFEWIRRGVTKPKNRKKRVISHEIYIMVVLFLF